MLQHGHDGAEKAPAVKQETHIFLEKNNFNTAKSVYVHHEHYWAERNKNIIQTNIYKEYVHNEIKKLKFPVVIKDTTGLSSYGMDVVQTYNEAIHILNSKKNNGDRLVEEYITGDSFGIEIYGNENNYFVSEVLINSVNQFGLTSPKQNVKLGPVLNEKCPDCHGSGQVRYTQNTLFGQMVNVGPCKTCNASGKIIKTKWNCSS